MVASQVGEALQPRPRRLPILLLLPACLVLVASRDERDAARRRLFFPALLAATLVIWIVKASLEANGREIMHMVSWKRLLIRAGLLLVAGLNVLCSFLALGTVADKLFLKDKGPSVSLGSVRMACAIVAVAAHLPIGWTAIAGV